MRRRWIIALCAVGAISVPAATAHAQVAVPQTLACSVSLGGEFSPAMPPQGGSGTYATTTQGLLGANHCTWDTYDLFFVRTATRGSYGATSCGTGTLRGDPASGGTTIELAGGPLTGWRAPVVYDMSYTLELRDWQGILRVTHVNGRPELGGDDVDGVFSMVPQHLCRAAPVTWYTLDGSFTVTW